MRLFMRACVAIGFLAASGGVPAVAQSCNGDVYEQDDGCVLSRTMIQGGSSQAHDFCDDTRDWLAFNACSGRTYTIWRRPLNADERFVKLAETAGKIWVDAATDPIDWEYEVTFTIGP